MAMLLKRIVKGSLQHTSLAPLVFRRYSYCFSPRQLAFLIDCIDRTAALPGPILEIGCFDGSTTVWINRHLDDIGVEKPYIALDTFKGFPTADVDHEADHRGKAALRDTIQSAFTANDKRWVETTMRVNRIERVTLVEADASNFDYSRYRDISFALVDVDLYQPVKRSLERIYPLMAKGGIIVVDDCTDAEKLWDGALQAYREFTTDHGLPFQIVHGKLGIITT